MGTSRVGDFIIGLLSTWALVLLAISPLLGPMLALVGIVAVIVTATRAQRPFIVWGVISAIALPVLVVGACMSVYGVPGM